MQYPQTRREDRVELIHGVEVHDPYRWLEDTESEEVKQWIKAQNELTRTFLNQNPWKKRFLEKMIQLGRYDSRTMPRQVRDSDRIFFYSQKKDQERMVYNMQEHLDAESSVVFDPNQWGDDTLEHAHPSPDGRFVAYGLARGGDENPTIRIRDLESGKDLPDRVRGWKQYFSAWMPDNSGFLYGSRPLKGEVPEGEEYYWPTVWFHKLGTDSEEDLMVMRDPEVKENFCSAQISSDATHIIINRGTFYTNEVYLIRIASGDFTPKPFITGFDAEFNTDIVDGKIIIETDWNTPNRRIMSSTLDKPDRDGWQTLISESDDLIENFSLIDGKMLIERLHNAYTSLSFHDLDGRFLRELSLPGIGSAAYGGLWSKPWIALLFTSFTSPTTIYRYDYREDRLHEMYRVPIDTAGYEVDQVWYKSKDGTSVSMFLIHHRDMKRNGANPCMLTGYGGFNDKRTPRFSPYYLAWLKEGGMIALPNLRGGGEYGQNWHKAGMLEKKQNVFDDFIAAAEYLIHENYSAPKQIGIIGGSNGGLLTGAVTMQRPDLFGAVVCMVPLLDMVRYHKFGFANIWTEEYGNADNPEQFPFIYKYSPYHNVEKETTYPAVLFTASINDARTHPLHAYKMTAAMQHARSVTNR